MLSKLDYYSILLKNCAASYLDCFIPDLYHSQFTYESMTNATRKNLYQRGIEGPAKYIFTAFSSQLFSQKTPPCFGQGLEYNSAYATIYNYFEKQLRCLTGS